MTDSTDNARGPDWEGFGRDLLEHWPVRDVDGSELFDAALRNGLIAEIPGGYDPDQHIDAEGICPEAGDPWYEYAFHPVRADLPPKVKPLEWDDVQAETPFGAYDFGYVGRVWTLRFCGNQIEYGIAGNCRTARAEAKDAAQHHFATRILSTLKLTGGKDD
jgi:hypothetical protein